MESVERISTEDPPYTGTFARSQEGSVTLTLLDANQVVISYYAERIKAEDERDYVIVVPRALFESCARVYLEEPKP